jgi:MFS superfamily sulfate permease-like transporter
MGLPVPQIPAMTNASNYVFDAILIGVISYVISLSLAKSFARKYKYQIDPNREMLAYGISNSVGGIFSCFAGAAAPPICCVQETTRGKSQMVSLVSSAFVLLVCLAAGPLIEPLPSSSLGAIVIVALLPVFKRLAELKLLWHLNKWDVAVWMVTWFSVTFLDVITGAGLGMIFNLIVLTLQHQMLGGQKRANAKDTEIYVAGSSYKSVAVPEGIAIFYFSSNLVYVNADRFKNDLFKMIDREADVANIDVVQLIGAPCVDLEYYESSLPPTDADVNHVNNAHSVEPIKSLQSESAGNEKIQNSGDLNVINYSNSNDKLQDQMNLKRVHFKNEINEKMNMSSANGVHNSIAHGNGIIRSSLNGTHTEDQKKIVMDYETDNKMPTKKNDSFSSENSKFIRSIIVDCSAISFLDIVGLNVLTLVNGLLVGQGRRMVLAQCTPGLLRQLTAAEISGVKVIVYPTVHDAVVMETSLRR